MRVVVMEKKTLVSTAVCLLLVVVAAVCTVLSLAGEEQEVFAAGSAPAIRRVAAEDKVVALTFDTAFGEDQTEKILEILKRRNVKATFAVMGMWAQQNPHLLGQIMEDGHEVISHSMVHERYADLSPTAAVEDARAAANYLKLEAGVETVFIRPPYGQTDEKTSAALTEAGFIPLAWSLDSRDWQQEDPGELSRQVLSAVRPGEIVLFQNNRPVTPLALEEILQSLDEMDYSCCTVSQMVATEGYTVDAAGVQKAAAGEGEHAK